MSANYNPTDNLPFVGLAKSGQRPGLRNATVIAYINDILQNGPLPRNWEVELCFETVRSGVKLKLHRYVLRPGTGRVEVHPNSQAARQSAAQSVIANEFADNRERITGVYHPPIPAFKVTNLAFHHHGSWQAALTASLVQAGCTEQQNGVRVPLTEANLRNQHNTLCQNAPTDPDSAVSRQLYHPSDRGTMVFADEPECARLAQLLNRDLAILCPITPANGQGYDRFWQQSNRPPVYWRWSTGDHGFSKIATLACLPVYGKGVTREVHWFTVTPQPSYQATWNKFFQRDRNFAELKRDFNFPDRLSTDCFVWTLVAAHRSYINEGLPENTNLGNWVHQYGKYILKYTSDEDQMKYQFKYNPAGVYNGIRIDGNELGAWILNSDAALVYVRLWEKSSNAHVRWLLEKSDANLQVFKQHMAAATKVPN